VKAILVAFLFFGLATHASAQTSVGVHYSALVNEYPDEAPSGAGTFLTLQHGMVGIDAATTFFFPAGLGDVLWQVLAGPRAGVVAGRVGAYGRTRVGFGRFSQRFFKPGVVCIAIFPPPESCLADQVNLHLDLGGTLELAMTPSKMLRVDVGDTLTRWSGAPPDTQWTHGLQFTTGFGWTF
jgi:hypothetical protein